MRDGHGEEGGAGMTSLELRGVAGLLRECLPHLEALGYGGRVYNGGRCPSCYARGIGSSEPHDEGCRGVALLREVREAAEALEKTR